MSGEKAGDRAMGGDPSAPGDADTLSARRDGVPASTETSTPVSRRASSVGESGSVDESQASPPPASDDAPPPPEHATALDTETQQATMASATTQRLGVMTCPWRPGDASEGSKGSITSPG